MFRELRLSALTLVLLTGALALSPFSAHARFILSDSNFDLRAAGSSLDRRGAEYGEPTLGPWDTQSEVIVEESPGDMAVRSVDTVAGINADLLYFTFADQRVVEDGRLSASVEVTPEISGNYVVELRDPTYSEFPVASIIMDDALQLYWRDNDDVGVHFVMIYTPGVPLLIEFEMNLDTGTYDLIVAGLVVVADEGFDTSGSGIGALVVGNQFDNFPTAFGSLLIDDVEASWDPGTATELLLANFNDKPVGAPIGTGGAEVGEPTDVLGDVEANVKLGVTPTPSLEIADDGNGDGLVRFGLRDGLSMAEGSVSVRHTLLFDSFSNWRFKIRGMALKLEATDTGALILYDTSGGTDTEIARHPYSIGFQYKLEFAFEFDFGLYSWWVADERIAHRVPMPVDSIGVQGMNYYCYADPDLDGRIRVDNLRIFHSGSVTPAPLTPLRDLAVMHGASPNPFNPATTIAFELPRSSEVSLEIFDSRGRHVRTLASGEQLSAGTHRMAWNGVDDGGRSVASGVYHALLTTPTGRDSSRLVLVK